MTDGPQQDLPVVLHNDKRGLLTVEEGRLDVLQLSRDGRREFTFGERSQVGPRSLRVLRSP